jgi:hypothetical protein
MESAGRITGRRLWGPTDPSLFLLVYNRLYIYSLVTRSLGQFREPLQPTVDLEHGTVRFRLEAGSNSGSN